MATQGVKGGTIGKVIPATLATLLLAACGSNNEQEASASASVNNDGVTITGSEGERVQVAGGNAAVSALPDGFTAYPGASVTSSTAISTGNGGGVILVMTTPDAPAKVIDFYREQATAAGVHIEGQVVSGPTTLIGGEGEGGLAFSASAAEGPDGTIVQLTVGRD